MPTGAQVEHPAAAFARELEALVVRYTGLIQPADVAQVLAVNLIPLLGVYCDDEVNRALQAHFVSEGKKRMAKVDGLPS